MDPLFTPLVSGYLFGGLLLLTRLIAVVIALPGFGDSYVPVRVRLLVALAMTVVMDLGTGPAFVPVPGDAITVVLLLGREAILGAGMGLAVRLVTAAIEVAGSISGISMALSLNVFLDPTTGEQQLSLGALFGMVGALLFVALDGHHLVILTLSEHLQHYPVGAETLSLPSPVEIAAAGVDLGRTALLLAAPVVVVTLLIYIALAFVGRIVPQVNLFGVGLSLVIGAGFLVLAMSGDAVIVAVERGIADLPQDMLRLSGGGP